MSFQQAVLPLLDVCWTSFLWGIYMEYPINGVWLPRLFLVLFSGGIFSIVCLRLSYCPQQKSGLYILFMAHELKSAHHPAASCSFSSFARYLLKVEQNMVISAASLSSLITKLITRKNPWQKIPCFFFIPKNIGGSLMWVHNPFKVKETLGIFHGIPYQKAPTNWGKACLFSSFESGNLEKCCNCKVGSRENRDKWELKAQELNDYQTATDKSLLTSVFYPGNPAKSTKVLVGAASQLTGWPSLIWEWTHPL